MAITIEILTKIKAKSEIIDDIIDIQIEYFKEYPYLQQLDKVQTKEVFTSKFLNEHSIFVIAKDANKLVSANIFIPFSALDYQTAFELWFRKNNETKEKYIYAAYTMTIPEYRSRGIVKEMMAKTNDYLKEQGYKGRMMLSISRPDNDPKAPEGWRQPRDYFLKRGYEFLKLKPASSFWTDIGDDKPTEKMYDLLLMRL